jgi:hypothetical protein
MQEQQSICDAGEAAQKEMQAKLTAKDAELALQNANVQRLEAELARTKAEAAALHNICNAKESKLKEIESGLAREGPDKNVQTAVSSEDAHAEDRVASIIMNDMLDAENATQHPIGMSVNKINRVSAATAQVVLLDVCEGAELKEICNAKESEPKEIRAKLTATLTATAEGKERAKEESFQVHQARGAEKNNVVPPVGLQQASTYNDPLAGNIAQESELTDIRVKLLAQEELFEVYKRDLKAPQQTLEKTYQAKMELEQLEDADLPDTVDKAERARRSDFFLLLYCSKYRC